MKLENLRRYAYLAGRFRNGWSLIQSHRRGLPASEAVDWSGRRVRHPAGRGGLVGTLLEVWGEGCYDGTGPLGAGDVVVDAGAHVGLFSVRVASRRPGVWVIALEPCAENFACLTENARAFDVAGQVEARRCAVAGGHGLGVLSAPTARSIDHRLGPAAADDADAVPTLGLDDVVALAGGEVAFLKMDIEGAEDEAFGRAAASSLLALRRIALEYHDNLVPGTLARLRARLAPTHEVEVRPEGDRGYGLLFARRRSR